MTHKEQADQMVNEYRMILMNEDTDCGNEILCTMIAVKCALKEVNGIIGIVIDCANDCFNFREDEYWQEVKKELENYEL
tara:strand:+ start:492 stop:728 length:237 start_codon:yes stop_codon:yes gene_type:complete